MYNNAVCLTDTHLVHPQVLCHHYHVVELVHCPVVSQCKQCVALMLIMVNVVIQLLPFVTGSSETSSCSTLIVPVSNKTSGADAGRCPKM